MNAKVELLAPPLEMQNASYDIWITKYQLKTKNGVPVDKDINSTYERIAKALSSVEVESKRKSVYKDFKWALDHGVIPAGRIVSNAGAGEHKPATSTINCTVSGMVYDSMDDILLKNHEAGLTLKAGCGIGYEFSTLRPKGAYVAGAGATTSGPLSFMDIFDKMCFTVSSAGGRRGAQMATFDVHHPDILDFIQAKREDGRLRQFNLSLLITEDFINAVKNDLNWQLSFPLTAEEVAEDGLDLDDKEQYVFRSFPIKSGYVTNDEGLVACRIYQTLKAGVIWDSIMKSTYDFAEPGFILIDKVNEMNNNWFCENIRATNPCVAADTWVHTSSGPQQVKSLIDRSFVAQIDGKLHPSGDEGFFKTAHKPIIKLLTAEGYSLRLTEDHRVRRVKKFTRYTTETEWCEAGKLLPGDRVLLNDHRNKNSWVGKYTQDEGYLLGLLVGDGTLKQDKAVLSVWKIPAVANGPDNKIDAATHAIMKEAERAARSLSHRSDFTGWIEVPGRNEYRLSLSAIKNLGKQLDIVPGNKTITPQVETTSSEFYQGFLRGFFDADGSVQGNHEKGISIRLSQSDLGRLEAVQRMLLRLGIASRIYKNRREASFKLLPNGKGGLSEYPTKAQHELVISGENLKPFHELIGFADSTKSGKLASALANYKRSLNRERFVARVESLIPDGSEDVFDVQIPGINTFDANGLQAHNCGEQPLPPYGSCLLGSINLTQFVEKPFSDKATFNFEKYRKTVRIFTRMLDNVVEINGLPLIGQRNEINFKRRHGMGILGLGSTLTMMKMPYGCPDSIEFTERVNREMAVEGWKEALALGEEKGPAPIMEENFTVSEEMLLNRPEMRAEGYQIGDEIKGRVLHAKYSRYMQQIAEYEPELVEQLAEKGARFTHHTSIAPTGTISLSLANNASNGIEPSFAHHYARNIIREGKKTKEKVDVFSFELLAYRHFINPLAMPFSDDPETTLPDYFISADEVTPKQHVDIQAAAQKWVDSSISKTANVPTEFPYDEFKDIYMYAYDQGLKGCTTFRFNPEAFQGVLVKESDLEKTNYEFTLEDGSKVTAKGNDEIEYDGEIHTAANLFDAFKEGTYGKY